jgi:dihydrofolate synthase / folylpolyglutamate synthase
MSMLTSYDDTLEYLYANLPMFQRVGAIAFKGDLNNTLHLCDVLGNPHKKFKSVHVGGTNGKGSTSHMLASILQSSGYKTGLYTSPHLKSFTERIRIDGQEISRDFIVGFVNRIHPVIQEIKPSFFEITVAMAFDYFAANGVEVAVIEVGLGGRLDSTNVITPELSVITNIGWDHKDILGDTLEKIATEKAGIIKKHVPVVVSERQEKVEHVFIQKALEEQSQLAFASDEYGIVYRKQSEQLVMDIVRDGVLIKHDFSLPLQGAYQRKNVLGVLKAVDVMRSLGFSISEEQLWDGLSKVISQTGLKGRWQRLGDLPLVICDTGHNQDGISEVVAQIKNQSYRNLFMIIGMVKDKDVSEVLKLLPKEANYYFCQANIPRAMDAHVLAQKANAEGLTGKVVPDVNEAIRQAREQADKTDFIFIGGSTFVVAEISDL